MKFIDSLKKKYKFLNDPGASDFIRCVNCGKLEDAGKIKWMVLYSKKANFVVFLCDECYKKDKDKLNIPFFKL